MPAMQTLPPTQGWRMPSTYAIAFATLAPAGVANGNIQIQADSDFEIIKTMYAADIAAAAYEIETQPVPNVTIQITDTGTSRALFSNLPIPVPSFFGTGQLPFIWPERYIVKANSVLQIQVTNFDAAVTYNLRLTFAGVKVFKQG